MALNQLFYLLTYLYQFLHCDWLQHRANA